MARGATVCLLAVLALLCGCKPSRPAHTASGSAPKSVLDAYKEQWERTDVDRLMRTVIYLRPNTADLEVPESPPGTLEETIAFLKTSQSVLDSVEALSRHTPEPFPPTAPLNEKDPDAHMRHPRAWIQNFARMLSADAARLAATGKAEDTAKAAHRLAACVRLGNAMSRQAEQIQVMTGVGIVGQGAARAVALLEAGRFDGLAAEAKQDLRDAVAEVDFSATTGTPDFRNWVNENLARVRELLK